MLYIFWVPSLFQQETPMHLQRNQPMAHLAVQASLYFWWMAFLRCSKDYWWCCQQKGRCQDPRLVKVWEDFGDVFEYDCFVHWWQKNGARLFDSPQLEMEFIKFLSSGVEILVNADLVTQRPHMVCLAIPVYLETAQAQNALLQAWEAARVRGTHYARDAKYQLFQLDLKGRRTIVTAYRAWALNTCVDYSDLSQDFHRWGSFEMGRHLHLSPRNQIRDKDSIDTRRRKQNLIRTVFCQNKKTAQDLIANVEVGRFPCKSAVEPVVRWTVAQQKAMDHAISDGRWQSKQWIQQEHVFMLAKESAAQNTGFDFQAVQILDNFGALETSFLTPKRQRNKPH